MARGYREAPPPSRGGFEPEPDDDPIDVGDEF
jgi:hypothetical protein